MHAITGGGKRCIWENQCTLGSPALGWRPVESVMWSGEFIFESCPNQAPQTGWTETYFLSVLGAGCLRSSCPQGWTSPASLPASSRGRPSVCVWVFISSSSEDVRTTALVQDPP